MTPDAAEKLALDALAHVAGSEDLLAIFLGSTGASLADLRRGAGQPEFLVSVLDFLTMNDQWIIGFCDATGYGYGEPSVARQALSGGAVEHWT